MLIVNADHLCLAGVASLEEPCTYCSRPLAAYPLIRSDVRNLSRYMAELEELIESYRAFAATVTLSAPADRATQRKLLKRTHKIIGPPPDTLAETRPELAQCEDLVT
jgi:hypothetical protein